LRNILEEELVSFERLEERVRIEEHAGGTAGKD
jgi:hypothetical protein